MFLFLMVLGFELGASFLLDRHYTNHLSHSASPFCVDCFRDRVLKTICSGLASNHTLLILVS
jgi:hypothetical protein